ncbi:MAG: M42 family peptidase [Ruminococcus sp.]|nr:M42 family peptidase [Ruminococcus sp.]
MEINKSLLKTLLSELCGINGTSGAEERVREYITEKIKAKENCLCTVNPLGCLIVEYKGRKRAAKKLMIDAHMDEVGLTVTGINPDGTLNADCVGGVRADAVIGRTVVTEGGLIGAVGAKAVHHLSDEEREKPPKFGDVYIDIGACDKADAKEKVFPGDMVYFTGGYKESGGYVRSKAIDDRAGCAVMLAMILEDVPEYDCVFAFTTREEMGQAAGTAAFTVGPEYALVLEATTAADIPLSEGDKRCCILGEGAVVSYMDRLTIYDRGLYELSKKISREENIPWQTKTVIAGGNDGGSIHKTGGGVRTIAVSVPCRYLHTPCCVIKEEDLYSVYRMAVSLADKIAAGGA